MSALSDRIAREHAIVSVTGNGSHDVAALCLCGPRCESGEDDLFLWGHTRHVAEVTEAEMFALLEMASNELVLGAGVEL